jgi:glycerol dehydrogenase-like iron-containing ADH family enzyme
MRVLLVTSASAASLCPLAFDEMLIVNLANYDEILDTYCTANTARFTSVVGCGGGAVVDAAKYLAHRWSTPLTFVPTVLSTDAIFTDASAYRTCGCVKYHHTKPPNQVVYDDGVLAAAPLAAHCAGWGDILSCLVACWCWREYEAQIMERVGKTGLEYSASTVAEVDAILDNISCPSTPEARQQLFDGLQCSVKIEARFGFPIHEESAEHFFICERNPPTPGITAQGSGTTLLSLRLCPEVSPACVLARRRQPRKLLV